jgi:hypothetical protein
MAALSARAKTRRLSGACSAMSLTKAPRGEA